MQQNSSKLRIKITVFLGRHALNVTHKNIKEQTRRHCNVRFGLAGILGDTHDKAAVESEERTFGSPCRLQPKGVEELHNMQVYKIKFQINRIHNLSTCRRYIAAYVQFPNAEARAQSKW